MAEKLVSGDRCTARAVCRHFGLNRSTYAYRAKEADAWEAKLKGALRRKSNEHPELGYAKITRLLKQEGWQVGARNFQCCSKRRHQSRQTALGCWHGCECEEGEWMDSFALCGS
jgi:hypothetical protein